MRYKNTKTGAIIDSSCVIKGGDWIEAKEEVKEVKVETQPEEVNKVEETKQEPEQKEGFEGFDGITIKEIKQELDAFGIEYNPKARKQELYDLMMQGR
jgi:arginyl-tRNA synthetase